MTHLTMEQLLALREPGLEPGVQGWRDHASACELCRTELERLDQRVARLKALPTLRPARNRFAELRDAARRERRGRRIRSVVWTGLALAASVALAVVLAPRLTTPTPALATADPVPAGELDEFMQRSRQLEGTLVAFDPDRRVVYGRTAALAASLEDRIALVDRRLEVAALMARENRQRELLRLWRERVGLLDALVDVRMTRASYVGY
jgi:hypothetical protein